MSNSIKAKKRWEKSIIAKGVDHKDFEKVYPHIKLRGYLRYKKLIDELRRVKDQNKDNSKITIRQVN